MEPRRPTAHDSRLTTHYSVELYVLSKLYVLLTACCLLLTTDCPKARAVERRHRAALTSLTASRAEAQAAQAATLTRAVLTGRAVLVPIPWL